MNFIKKIFSPLILVFSLLLLIYIFYKSEIYWGGAKRNFYDVYYFCSVFLLLFSITSFFFSQQIKEYLIIFGITSFIFIYSYEGYLTLKNENNQLSKVKLLKAQLYEKQTGNKWDKRTTFQIYEDLKKKDNKIVVRIAPKNYIYENNTIFPLSGISNAETIYCNENGFYTIYKSDRFGFNNPNEEWNSKEIEYLLVGDSFTHGGCVNRPNDIASVLRILSNKSALNLGYGGNGPLIEYATLREYLDPRVKKVLWMYYEGNDLKNFTNEKSNRLLNNYLISSDFSQNLKLKQNEIDYLAKGILKRERKKQITSLKFDYIKFIKISNIRSFIFPVPAVEPTSITEFKKILQLANDFTIKNNSKLYFVYLPEYTRYKETYNNSNYNLIKNVVEELNISFIDIHKDVFQKENNPLRLFPFELFGHYNVEGYKKVAKAIYQLTKN